MKSRKELKEEKRQELISQKYPGALNFNLLRMGQEIKGERILTIHGGHNTNTGIDGEWIKIGTPEGYREVHAQYDIIQNEPCAYIYL